MVKCSLIVRNPQSLICRVVVSGGEERDEVKAHRVKGRKRGRRVGGMRKTLRKRSLKGNIWDVQAKRTSHGGNRGNNRQLKRKSHLICA